MGTDDQRNLSALKLGEFFPDEDLVEFLSRASRAGVARSSLEPCRVRLGLRQSWKDGSLRLPGTSLVGSPGCADPVEEAVSGTARGFQ